MALYENDDRLPSARWSPYGGGATVNAAEVQSGFLNGVYRHMALGLAVTGLVAMWAASSHDAMALVAQHPFILVIAQFGVVIALSGMINRMSALTATALFYSYSALTGLMLSVLFFVYTRESIATTFFVTGGTFAAVSAYGYITKRDLTGMGSFLMMGLIGLVIATVVNMFVASTFLTWITTYIGVGIFVGLTAFDTQKLKLMAANIEPGETAGKIAILGALTLYLDFINLFIYLMRIFGRRRN